MPATSFSYTHCVVPSNLWLQKSTVNVTVFAMMFPAASTACTPTECFPTSKFPAGMDIDITAVLLSSIHVISSVSVHGNDRVLPSRL